MTFLVTGAAGTVGRQVVERLLAAGRPVRALTRDPAAANLPERAEVVAGDLDDAAGLRPALAGATGVFLYTSAGPNPLTDGEQLVETFAELGVRRVVTLWSGFDGSVETALRASDLEWTILQPMEFMSNALTWADSIRAEGVVREPFANVRSTAIHPSDIAAVAVAALTGSGHAGRDYELTGPRALSFEQRVAILGEAIGRELRFEELSRQQAVDRLTAQDVPAEVAGFVMDWHADPPEAAYTVRSTVEDVTGRAPLDFTHWVTENRDAFV